MPSHPCTGDIQPQRLGHGVPERCNGLDVPRSQFRRLLERGCVGKAIDILLDRGWGRPSQPCAEEDGKKVSVVIRKITD